MQSLVRPKKHSYWFWIGGLLMSALALIPWWRNHAYLRDLYDYGTFMVANARMAAGERPYVDFGTPIQSAMYVFNYVAERLGGGTYLGMTWGVVWLAVAAVFGLALILARRWPAPLALLVAGAIVIGSVSQHTIILYNPLGVIALALVAWSFAIAPLLRREDLGWHAVAAFGLFLGGITKVNFHLVACAMAVGWVLFAASQQKSVAWRVLATFGFILGFGLVLPIAAELAWTGASLHQWYHHVIELPMLSRGGRLSMLFSPVLYLTTVNDYYGPQFRQTGLVGILLAGGAVVAAWRSPALATLGWRRIFLVLAGLLAALSGAALLATNNEITYVALSAWVVLGTSLWLGFGQPPRGGWFGASLILPVILLAVVGWNSAWRGQRSQFGHSGSPRASFLLAEEGGPEPEFAYVRGLHLPPEILQSVMETGDWRRSLPRKMQNRIYYGPGVEWLARIWPPTPVRGLPLAAYAFAVGPREKTLFQEEVMNDGAFHYVLVCEAWNYWGPDVEEGLARNFTKGRMGPVFFFYERLPAGAVGSRPIELLPSLGGNANPSLLTSVMSLKDLPGGRRFIGVTAGRGELGLTVPTNRASGEAVLQRLTHGETVAGKVHFEIFAVHGLDRFSRWAADVALPAGQDELIVRSGILDSSGLPLVFTVSVPTELEGQIAAGWRGPSLTDSLDGPERPPALLPGSWSLYPAGPAVLAALAPSNLKEAKVLLRNVTERHGQVQLPPGGEVWVKLQGLFSKISISAVVQTRAPDKSPPVFRVIYYKGGRLDMLFSNEIKDATPVHFDAWSPSNDGWLALLVDPTPSAAMVTVKIDSADKR